MDVDLIIAETRKLAEEFPDCTYNGVPYSNDEDNTYCSYSEGLASNNEPGCIFGQCFRRLDYPIDPEWNKDGGRAIFAVCGYDYTTRDQKSRWLDCVQLCQDEGVTWKEAVEHADREFPL